MSESSPTEDDEALYRHKLNLETAQIPWTDLQRHFAAGQTLFVDSTLDLVDVAEQMARDNTVQVEQWLHAGTLAAVSTDQARQWFEHNALMWAVVIKPWVLVQRKEQE